MDSDSDDLNDFLRIAAEEGELQLSENRTPANNTPSACALPNAISAKKGDDKPIKLAEEAYDSSDEEDCQSFLDRKYSEYGRDINTMLKRKDAARHDVIVGNEVDRSIRNSRLTVTNTPSGAVTTSKSMPEIVPRLQTSQPAIRASTSEIKAENVYTDPIFGLRIVQPLISSTMMKERMVGRKPVEIRYLPNHLQVADLSQDWCISGVIVNKGAIQTSTKGAQYVIWKLSDLKGEMKLVSLFLFKSAYKELWKTQIGMVIAVLNPSVFSRKDTNGESSLSIDSTQRVMILGRSKDYGICKSKKKNGEPCTAIVNLNVCEFCVYHVKQEYGKLSTRSELQSATSGRGLQALRNKVLGKSEVFYGGKSFMAEAKPTKKTSAKDQQRLNSLSDTYQSPLAAAVNNGKKKQWLTMVKIIHLFFKSFHFS